VVRLPLRILEDPELQALNGQGTTAVLTQVPRPIPAVFNRLAQAKLLGKMELHALLTRQGIDLRGTNHTRNALAQVAADQLPVEVVEAEILHALAARRARDESVPQQQYRECLRGGFAPGRSGSRAAFGLAPTWPSHEVASEVRGDLLVTSQEVGSGYRDAPARIELAHAVRTALVNSA
jgi:hypothetical protein